MSQGKSEYPIQKLLRRLIETNGPTPTDFVKTLKYWKHIDRATHRLALWLENGKGHDKIIRQIAWIYPQHAEELYGAIAATKEMKAAEAEAAFVERCKAEAASFIPFLHAEGETTIPNGITIFGITGGHRHWTRIAVPKDILSLPIDEQLPKLPDLMEAYRRKYNGLVPFFGKLTGFKLVRLVDYYQFDAETHLVAHVDKPFRHGECFVELR